MFHICFSILPVQTPRECESLVTEMALVLLLHLLVLAPHLTIPHLHTHTLQERCG